jgi:hypothetical protein
MNREILDLGYLQVSTDPAQAVSITPDTVFGVFEEDTLVGEFFAGISGIRDVWPALRLQQLPPASPRSTWLYRPPADTTVVNLDAHAYRSQRLPRGLRFLLPTSLAPPSQLHRIARAAVRRPQHGYRTLW